MLAVYQLGRGNEPMIEVGSKTLADALYIHRIPRRSWISLKVKGARLCNCILEQRLVRLGQGRPGIAKSIDDGIAAVAAEILQRHLHSRGGLPTFVLSEVQHALNPLYRFTVETFLDDLRNRLLPLHQTLEYRVEHVIRRQRILIRLVLAQLCRRRTGDNAHGNDSTLGAKRAIGTPAVAQLRESIDLGLVKIFDWVESAVHIAIERGVPHGHLRLVAGS